LEKNDVSGPADYKIPASMDKIGRVLVPHFIRRKLGLNETSALTLYVHENKIVITFPTETQSEVI
jgi:bifunctional DNA-binding transcriptional regulator/antitoxin component of YhaV-PrlF toxin-antitoxin module